MTLRNTAFFLLLSTTAIFPAYAQEQAVPEAQANEEEEEGGAGATDLGEEPVEGEEIVVTGTRLRGSVLGDIDPELTLDARDIRSYGASNISELLEQLAPQTASGLGRDGGQPVTLVNGRRISSFAEIRDIPPEAIERVEILPEEVALKYGYRADQRVVNFVLRQRFRAITGELEGGLATAGGRATYEVDANILRLNDNGRTVLDAEYSRQGSLLESERDLIQSTPSSPFDLLGNVTAVTPGAEIDPALGALAGQAVTVAAVPAGANTGTPTLAGFASGANNPNVTDLGDFRTLSPEQEEFSLNGTITRTILGDVASSINARYETTRSESLLGLPSGVLELPEANPFSPFGNDSLLYRYFGNFGALERDSRTHNGHVGLSMNSDILPWRWSFTANYDRGSTRTLTDRAVDFVDFQSRIDANDPAVNPYGDGAGLIGPGVRDRALSINDNANAELVLNGPVTSLPAGDIIASVRVGADRRGTRSETRRGGVETEREVSRGRGNVQANLDLPVASRREDVLPFLGNLSLNANAEVERLSDFGTLTTLGGGFNWEPIDELRLLLSFTEEDGAPSVQQLGDPVIVTPNVRVFDFVTGETVDISRIDGGNPDIRADSRRVFKIGGTLKPWDERELTLTANYVATRIDNPIASFPTATVEIEAAFPERFVRDASGRLVSIDNRPVNFARSERKELRWGINFSKPIGPETPRGGFGGQGRAGGAGGPPGATPPGTTPPVAPPAQSGQAPGQQAQTGTTPPAGSAPGAGPGGRRGPGGGRGGFGGGFGGRGQGRLQLSLYHTWRLQDEILIREGVPVLDLLDGSATGSRGGQAEHQIEFTGGVFKDGFGGRFSANWQSGTFVRADTASGTQNNDLFFSDFLTVNLRLFADLGTQPSLVRNNRWLRGTRVSLNVNNLFDNRLDVRDSTGATPFNYQPNYLDPLGRTVTLSIRKLFF